MAEPITLSTLRALRPGSSRLLTGAVLGALAVVLNRPGRRVRFEVDGWHNVPDGPAVWVANHTHPFDWVALRWVAWWRGRRLCNWVKPRTYEEGWRGFLDRTGNLPVVSRGYVIAADFRAVHGRVPDEAEYRALRDHVDTGAPLPRRPVFDAILDTPRDLLGLSFDPAERTWREGVERVFSAMMAATVAATATLVRRGVDLQIMPQGVTAQRLTAGHPGAIQAALALDLPLVPVGVNGFPRVWGPRHRFFPARGGTVRIRVGTPWRPAPIPGHTPFLPSSERDHADALGERTDDMMGRIAALLDPEHLPIEGDVEADVTGVARFV